MFSRRLTLGLAAGILAAQPVPPEIGLRGRGPGGFGGIRPETKLVRQFDQDGDRRLNLAERKAAREHLAVQPRGRDFPPQGVAFARGGEPPSEPGRKLSPADIQSYPKAGFYEPNTLRTLFLEFESLDWEKELADFYNSDVEVPATMTVDGKTYREIGVHYRGMSSFMMAGEGRKRPLNVSLDFVNKDQRLLGYRTLNLLNAHGDPTFLRGVLYLQIARDYIPAPKANFVRVVIQGEDWGIYPNVQQFNGEFLQEWFGTSAGARWKVPGSPDGRGGLAYLGEDPAPYKRLYEIKSADKPESWAALIHLCRVLNETPPDRLEKELASVLDVDGVLKFLALEKALINSDGYWIRASDYNLYLDSRGRFHLIPHDINETLQPAAGPGMRLGGGIDLDPFAGSDEPNKALLHKLLGVPSLRARYLGYVRDIAERWLNWDQIGPLAMKYHALIAQDVKADTRKLYSTQAFLQSVTEDSQEPSGFGSPPGFGPPGAGPRGLVAQGPPPAGPGGDPRGFRGPRGAPGELRGPGGPSGISLKSFVEKRRAYLLSHPEISKAVALR